MTAARGEKQACTKRAAAGTAEFAEQALAPLSRHYPDTPDWYLA